MTSASASSEQAHERRPTLRLRSVQAAGTSTPLSAGRRPPQETGASQKPVELNSLPERIPPLADKCRLHGARPGPDQVTVIAGQAALRQIAAHSGSNLSIELGGALLGRAYRHNNRVFVEVSATIPATSQDHGPVHFTFSADSWTQLQRDRAAHYPNLDIVGWFHTHPGMGVFYSGDDVVVHSAAFTLPWHVGLVLDPVRNEACFFGWDEGALVPFAGFYELLDNQAGSVVNWRVARSAVWQEGQYDEYDQSDSPASRVYTPASSWFALLWLKPRLGLIAGALGLLLSFFLLVGWVIPLARQVNRLENVVLTLADEALADSNAAACPDPNLRLLTPVTGSRFRAGERVIFMGTADHPDAARYRIEARPAGADSWTLVEVQRWDTTLGQLAQWDTTSLMPGLYELRLTAVDRNNIRLARTSLCIIEVNLMP